MTATWRVSIYDLVLAKTVRLASTPRRYLYVVDGACRIDAAGSRSTVLSPANGAAVEADGVLSGNGTVWLCEAAPAAEALLPPSAAFCVLSKVVAGSDAAPRLFRVDRIDLAAGAVTPRHFHRGPGIRRLIEGRVRVEIGPEVVGVGPGGAWFEPGDEPVIGANALDGHSAFLRFSLLPAELLGGKSSFVPASDADAARPRGVEQRLLHEAMLDAQ